MMSMRIAILLCLGAGLAGCPPDTPQQDLPSISVVMPPDTDEEDEIVEAVYVVRIEMGTIEIPIGQASGSRELWSYLDEEPLSLRAGVLGRNGMRVGVGRSDIWPDVTRVLEKMTGRKYSSTLIQAQPGKSTPIVLKPLQPIQTIFMYQQDGSLYGADYPPGDNLLTILCTLDPQRLERVLLTATPQIRTTKRVTRLVEEFGITRAVHRPVFFPFREMTFQVPLDSGDFLVIAPGIMSRRPTSLAHHFLTRQKEGMEMESVLILKPQVYQIEYTR